MKFLIFLTSRIRYIIFQLNYKLSKRLNFGILNKNFEFINHEPFIGTKRFVLSEIECKYIKSLALGKLKRSRIYDPISKNHFSKFRTSSTLTLNFYDDVLIFGIVKRISKIMSLSYKNIPSIEISRYKVGDFFAHHDDAFNSEHILERLKRNETQFLQRFVTVICYLNTPEKGGVTSFPYLNKQISPEIGKLLIFKNTKKNSIKPNLKMCHSGDPVEKGEKWIMTFWFYSL